MDVRDKQRFENEYARLADADSRQVENGLGKLLSSVDDWSQHEQLKSVKKRRGGRHRFYFVGRHTDCQYKIVFILVNKRDKDDQPGKKWFQDPIIKALLDPEVRVIPPPPIE